MRTGRPATERRWPAVPPITSYTAVRRSRGLYDVKRGPDSEEVTVAAHSTLEARVILRERDVEAFRQTLRVIEGGKRDGHGSAA